MNQEPARLQVRLGLLVFAAFLVHAAVDGGLAIRGARPDLGLTAFLICCLYVNGTTGAGLGLLIGLLEASYTDRYVGSIIVSRTLTGFVLGLLEERVFRDNLLMALAAAVLGTMTVETLFFLFAPQPHALRWLIRAGEAAVYNGVLAVPLYFLIRRVGRPRR